MTSSEQAVSGTAKTDKPRTRRPEIDFLRGSMLMLMVVYHNFRVATSADPVQMGLMSFTELLSTVFLLVSGVNVANFVAGAARNPDFAPTQFYFKSAFWLFVMGYSYNLLVHTPFVMDLIQCIAVGTFVTYVLLRFKVSNALVGLITLAFFAAGIVAFGNSITLSPDVKSNFLLHQLIGDGVVAKDVISANGVVTKAGISALVPTPYLFSLYGPIPWVGFFTLGIFLDRLRGKWVWIACTAAVALALVGAYLPTLDAAGDINLGFRTNARYIVQSASLVTVWFFLSKVWYKEKTTCNRTVAFWSEVSLIVFVFHWIFIMLATTVIAVGSKVTSFYFFHDGFRYTRAVLSFAATAWAIRPIENLRARLSRHPKFLSRMRVIMIAGFATAILFGTRPAPAAKAVAYAGCLAAACSFALSYPAFRAKWRKEAVRK